MTSLPVSVCIIAHNEESHILACIRSLVQQTFQDFEIVVVDDCSTDNTCNIVSNFGSGKIRYFRNESKCGVARSRNRCIKESRGRYMFFSDADCTFAKNWIEEGVKALEQRGCDGVEGRVVYVAEDYRPTMADALRWLPKAQRDKRPSHFVGANVAYRKEFVERVGGFDEKYTYLSDRGLGLKVARQGGRLCFSSEMIVYHPREVWTVRGYVRSGAAIKNRAHLFKDFGDRDDIWWRVVSPRLLLMVVCPPLVVLSPFVYSFHTWEDFRLLPFVYFRALYGRICLWRECIRDRVFLI